MTEHDSIFSDLDQKAAALIRIAQELAMARRYELSQRLMAERQAESAEEAKLRVSLSAARPYLSEGLKDRWWESANQDDARHMLGIAERFRTQDPTAEAVCIRGQRECMTRWGIDLSPSVERTTEAVNAPAEDLAAAEARLEHEPATDPASLRLEVAETATETLDDAELSRLMDNIRSGSLPEATKAILLAKMSKPNKAQAEAELQEARTLTDALNSDQRELEQRLANNDLTAQTPLATLGNQLASAMAVEDRTTDLLETIDGPETEEQVAARLRDESFSVDAAEGIKTVKKSAAKRRKAPKQQTGKTRARTR